MSASSVSVFSILRIFLNAMKTEGFDVTGYPLRPPLISRFFDRVIKLKVAGTEVSLGSSYVLQRQIQEDLSISCLRVWLIQEV